ncbi:hypothetical protein NDU88_000942 [Pleurodeles waltl]|uniref:Uncharacterized protein n=1 Tax=Pleurodeles waltl TaxID=8319 RepID=A0AAV7MTA4_PLEWA|nr:hypothetical protein NDU88_000942 [Pleurodeles waltl]
MLVLDYHEDEVEEGELVDHDENGEVAEWQWWSGEECGRGRGNSKQVQIGDFRNNYMRSHWERRQPRLWKIGSWLGGSLRRGPGKQPKGSLQPLMVSAGVDMGSDGSLEESDVRLRKGKYVADRGGETEAVKDYGEQAKKDRKRRTKGLMVDKE